jgi:hypothetical protein
MSRRDGAIVAWHEVPGTAPPQESRPVGYGVIRAGVGADSGKGHSIEQQLEHHWTRTFQEEYLASVKQAQRSSQTGKWTQGGVAIPFTPILLNSFHVGPSSA